MSSAVKKHARKQPWESSKPSAQSAVKRASTVSTGQVNPSDLPPAPPLPPPPGATRVRKAPVRFRRQGELDGAASAFRSAPRPPSSRAAVSLADESAVLDYVTPGASVWVRGWFPGRGEWFAPRVVKVRLRFPKIHVCYVADGAGNWAQICPPQLDAYLCGADVHEFVTPVE